MTKFTCPNCKACSGYPMLIAICGHSICQQCVEQLHQCPTCHRDFLPWMLVDNYALITDTTTNRAIRLESDEQEIDSLLTAKKRQQNLISESYIEKTSNNIIHLLARDIGENPIKCRFVYTVRGEDAFYANLVYRVANRIQRALDAYRVDVKVEATPYSTLNERQLYSNNISILLPVWSD